MHMSLYGSIAKTKLHLVNLSEFFTYSIYTWSKNAKYVIFGAIDLVQSKKYGTTIPCGIVPYKTNDDPQKSILIYIPSQI